MVDSAAEQRFRRLPDEYASARRVDRRRLIASAVGEILKVAHDGDHDALAHIGTFLHSLVYDGTMQQKICCKLAIELSRQHLPRPVVIHIVEPLRQALIEVLSMGAPTTRDVVIAGLAVLLRILGHPHERLALRELCPEDVGEGDPVYNARYLERMKRRRRIVLAVAGDRTAITEVMTALNRPLDSMADDALYDRTDQLRALPALVRQSKNEKDIQSAVKLLAEAAAVPAVPEDEAEKNVIAFARYQESVFRTIDVLLEDAPNLHPFFDSVVAGTVSAIPVRLATTTAVSNARIRATIAIVRTAFHLAASNQPGAKAALRALLSGLKRPTPWCNLGIVEGYYRALPDLLELPGQLDLIGPLLSTLFTDLEGRTEGEELVVTHRRIVASAAFRRIVVKLADRVRQAGGSDADVEHAARTLLQHPHPRVVTKLFLGLAHEIPPEASHIVMGAIAFESDLLQRLPALYARWPEMRDAARILLTRVLGAELHLLSRVVPAIGLDPVLRRLFRRMTSGTRVGTDSLWQLFSELPADAATGANAEIQRFVERRRPTADKDLPRYVLAQISPDASSRIADAIAREIDLNFRREQHDPGVQADLAKLLYQVMLRGPHESIFDHLTPRLKDATNRRMVVLFGKHVAAIRESTKRNDVTNIHPIRRHIRSILRDLEPIQSPTLRRLAEVFRLYRRLTHFRPALWDLLRDGGPAELFAKLDELAKDVHAGSGSTHEHALAPTYRQDLASLQAQAANYLDLPVDQFAERSQALDRAVELACRLEQSLARDPALQPPEATLLVALFRRLRDLFERTNLWYAVGADRVRRIHDRRGFWLLFGCTKEQRRALGGGLGASPRRYLKRLQAGRQPPNAKWQLERFQEYTIRWMAADLDVDGIEWALAERRWPRWFRELYQAITNPWWTFLLIGIPFAVATLLYQLHQEHLAGAGFFLIAAGLLAAAVYSFTRPWIGRSHWRDAKGHGYWFEALLPKLARLIAVPMVLIIEFDHSYAFPFEGTDWGVALLLLLALLTTSFFIAREIVDRTERPGVFHLTKAEKARVRKIFSLALAQSFGIAVLFSMIFATTYFLHHAPPQKVLFGVIPRLAVVDFGQLELFGWSLNDRLAPHARFFFYPTLILSWTALGLFFGVFLEGFMKGARLRGSAKEEKEATE